MVTEYPWLSVSGFGAHIKSTPKKLIIHQKGSVSEYDLDSVNNLLIIGGHSINSATITHLVKKGATISFFEPDGAPVGMIRPFEDKGDTALHTLQQNLSRHRYAVIIAQSAIRSRLYLMEKYQEIRNTSLFYEGELELLHKSLEEISNLIKLEEIRRVHRLTSDMYYEIMSRPLSPVFGFKRRTIRPQADPVNAMLSLGYAMLFGNCSVVMVGSRLDLDYGLMNEGKFSLVYDLIEPLKAEMIDMTVFRISHDSLNPADYELIPGRCILSDNLMKILIYAFHGSIDNRRIGEQVAKYREALSPGQEFKV